jgi:hypothetical protein
MRQLLALAALGPAHQEEAVNQTNVRGTSVATENGVSVTITPGTWREKRAALAEQFTLQVVADPNIVFG